MDHPTIRYADSISLDLLTTMVNRAFEGYFVPMAHTAESLARMITTNDVHLAQSLLLEMPDAGCVGVALLGVRDAQGWVAGMGIAPGWRGRGLGEQLMSQLIEQVHNVGIRQLRLEVLEQNIIAQRLYARCGFQIMRSLAVYTGPLAIESAPPAMHDSSCAITPISPSEALAHFHALHSVAPPWQREHTSLLHMSESLQGLALWRDDELCASLLYNTTLGGYALLDLGSRAPTADERCQDGIALLRELVRAAPTSQIRAINMPPGDALGDALAALQCPISTMQREMVLYFA